MHEIIKITNGVKLNKFLWSKYCIHLMLGTTNEKSTQHTPTILKYAKEKHKKCQKLTQLLGTTLSMADLPVNFHFQNYLFTRNTVLIIVTK